MIRRNVGWFYQLLTLLIASTSVHATDVPRMAIFDIELQDASYEGQLQGIREDQSDRLVLISEELRALLAASGRYEVVDIKPVRDQIEERGPIQYCNGCDRDIAEQLGAQLSMAGFVYKVSNLILEIHLYVRDVASGNIQKKMISSIRGNDDRSWLHGIRWMVENRVLTE